MSWFSDFLFGKQGKIDYKTLEKIMQLDAQYNRTDRQGIFTSHNWAEDPETGQWTQTTTMNEDMQPAYSRFVDRMQGAGMEPYQSPDQFSSLLDAKMANQMERHGILNEQTRPNLAQQNYGTRAGDRSGRMASVWAPPPPPNQGPPPDQGPPPSGGQPPQNMNPGGRWINPRRDGGNWRIR